VNEMRYTDALGLMPGDVVSIVGSGGKTSLLWRLAEENRGRRVLVSTTTKMWFPPTEAFDWDVSVGRDVYIMPCGCIAPSANACYGSVGGCRGAQCAPVADGLHCIAGGTENIATCGRTLRPPTGISLLYGAIEQGKILAPDIERLTDLSAKAELTLLECDGSSGLPLKGWASHEPVVPCFTTVTIGILPLWAIGRQVCESVVHRMPEFCRIAGAEPGETVTAMHLARVIGHSEGLFAQERGRRVLFLNDRGSVDNRGSAAGGMTPPLRGAEAIVSHLDTPMEVLAGDLHRGTVEGLVCM